MSTLTPNMHTKGFTLIEVLVSLALFAIVVTVSVGSLLVLFDANVKAQMKKELLNQVSFTLDAMVRDIRTGYNYRCDSSSGLADNAAIPKDCTNGSQFAFTESGGSLTDGLSSNRIGYRLSGGKIQQSLSTSGWVDMTPDEVVIDRLSFIVSGTDKLSGSSLDTVSPTVSIIIEGRISNGLVQDSDFTLQTTVTQQLLDI